MQYHCLILYNDAGNLTTIIRLNFLYVKIKFVILMGKKHLIAHSFTSLNNFKFI
jgi:hypothetical protein